MSFLQGLVRFYYMAVDLPSVYLFFGYLAMIFVSGVWQKSTKPLGLRPVLIVHNFSCCILSAVTLVGMAISLHSHGSIYGKTPNGLMRKTFWVYWVTKVMELLDTVFMILRHKSRQISFLHVYHHSSMLILSDMSRLLYPWPSIATFLSINSFIHVCLYLYYGLTALNPNNPPQWKKQLTQLQILQFVVGIFIAAYGYVKHDFCVYSIFYAFTMLSLFSNFYYQAYIRNKPNKFDKKGE